MTPHSASTNRRSGRAAIGSAHTLIAAAIGLALAAPAFSAPIPLGSLNRVGTTELLAPDLLRLTPNFDTNPGLEPPPAGAAWTTTRFDVANPFAVSFQFRMWDQALDAQLDNDGSGGDGIAFLIQNDPLAGNAALGRGAGGMGFLGIHNSVAVMFDTYQNNAAYGDPNGNYVAVNTRGTDFNVPHHFCTDGQLTTDPALIDLPGVTCTSNPGLGMTTAVPRLDGPAHRALISYVPGTLSVYLNSLLVLSVPIDLASTLALANGTDAYLGFTAGTRFSYQNQDILDFQVIPEPSAILQVLAGLGVLGIILRRRRRSARA